MFAKNPYDTSSTENDKHLRLVDSGELLQLE